MVRAAQPMNPVSAKFCAFEARLPKLKHDLESLPARRANYDAFVKGFPAAPGITTIDIRVPNGNLDVPCRLYWTGGMANPVPRPVVIYFHGGGHTIGSVAGYDNFCRSLCAAAGVQVLSVDYRLCPENKHPAGVEDCFKVLRWVVDGHGSSYGLDGSRVALAGDSAGGHAVAVVCLMARDDGIADRIRFALALVPELDNRPSARDAATDPEASIVAYQKGYILTREDIAFFTTCGFADTDRDVYDWRGSPIAGNLSGLPKMYLISAGYDPLRDEAEAFARLAKAAGSPVDHECQEDEFHVWFLVGGMPQAREAVARFGRMLREGVGLPPRSRL